MTDTKWRIGKSFAKYAKEAQTPVDPSRLPFVACGLEIGSVRAEDAEIVAKAVPEFSFDGKTLELPDTGITETERSALFERAAEALRGAGRVKFWRGELLDVRPAEDAPRIAVLERSLFRVFGLLTFAVHMNGITPEHRMWVAQRSETKAVNPGKWDNIAAGMISAGEDPLTAMRREAHEEAGFTSEDYELSLSARFYSSHPTESGWLREVTLCFTARLREGVTPHNLDGEVQATELLDADQAAELIARGKLTSEAALAAISWLAPETGKMLPEGFFEYA